jgi:hypothetical protein
MSISQMMCLFKEPEEEISASAMMKKPATYTSMTVATWFADMETMRSLWKVLPKSFVP